MIIINIKIKIFKIVNLYKEVIQAIFVHLYSSKINQFIQILNSNI